MTWSINSGDALNSHPEMSRWYQWPFLTCKMVVYAGNMFSMGNPVVWWTAATVMLCSIFTTPYWLYHIIFARRMSRWKLTALVFVVGYFGNLAPFFFIERSTWNYHYLLALLIAIAFCGFLLDGLMFYAKRYEFANAARVAVSTLVVLMLLAFWYWSPWTYGEDLTYEEDQSRRWYSLWRKQGPNIWG